MQPSRCSEKNPAGLNSVPCNHSFSGGLWIEMNLDHQVLMDEDGGKVCTCIMLPKSEQ